MLAADLLDKYNRYLSALIVYCISLFLLIGLTYKDDVEGAMFIFIELYGIPLAVFIIVYGVITANIIYHRFRHQQSLPKVLLSLSIKIILAASPVFTLDNRMASMLHVLNNL